MKNDEKTIGNEIMSDNFRREYLKATQENKELKDIIIELNVEIYRLKQTIELMSERCK